MFVFFVVDEKESFDEGIVLFPFVQKYFGNYVLTSIFP